MKMGLSNNIIVEKHLSYLKDVVFDRLSKLFTEDVTSLNATELVKRGYCDVVRLFIKQEPHSKAKADKKRWRLISSVSLIDQIIERMLFGLINKHEILRWDKLPYKPGMGFSSEQVPLLCDYVRENILQPTQSDISGWDWSLPDWCFDADLELRANSFDRDIHDTVYYRAMKNRLYCLSFSVFQLSNGTLYAQRKRGLMKSGSYLTSSTNSHIRVFLAALNGCRAMSMGDDAVEDYNESTPSFYASLGFTTKFYSKCVNNVFEFCSHIFFMDKDRAYALNIGKEVMRLLHRKDLKSGDDKKLALMQLEDDLCGNPNFPQVLDYLQDIGWWTA